MHTDLTKSNFQKTFKSSLRISSPGRINLIGEHTDYNQGYALPTAIDKHIHFEFRKNETDHTCNIFSKTYDDYFSFELNNFSKMSSSWKNYILGVVDQIQKNGNLLAGFDCTLESNLPIGAGISSSAALECGLATGLNELFQLKLSKQEIIALSQRAENQFVGSQCGIMDQYASVMSKKDHLILLDCQSVTGSYIPADFKTCQVVLLNTNVAHNLAEGEYNTRRKECEQAVLLLKEKLPSIHSLRDIDLETLAQFQALLPPVTYQRARYVIQENERVLAACRAIEKGDLEEFGALMYQSHEGLQHQYEVSCKELDFLVDYSRDKKFVYGSRMMGGGFGGCTINLIEEKHLDEYIKAASTAYRDQFNIDLDAIVVSPTEGTRIFS